MEPTYDPYETAGPSRNELIRDVIQTGQQMFAAGRRLLDNLDQLRGSAGESEWRIEFRKHPYLWIAAGVGTCLLLAAILRPERTDDPYA